jgi:uncharacterized repeat protein (TIGR01451 family)
LFSVRPDGTGLTPLAPDLDGVNSGWPPAITADGSTIAFAGCSPCNIPGERNSGLDVYLIHRDGSGLRQLTFSRDVGEVALSGDGSKIAFVRFSLFLRLNQVVVVNGDGSGERLLFQEVGEGRLSLSSDGSKIAFSVPRTNSFVVMNTDGSGSHEFHGLISVAALSGGGNKVVYFDIENGLFVANADGTDARLLTAPGVSLGSPITVTTDGSAACYVSDSNVMVVDTQTGSFQNVTNTPPTDPFGNRLVSFSPSLSGNGSAIAFLSNADLDGSGKNADHSVEVFVALLGPALPQPTNLGASVGDRSIYLRWDPLPVLVDHFLIDAERLDEVSNVFVPIGTVSLVPRQFTDQEGTAQESAALITEFPNNVQVANDTLYRLRVRPEKGGTIGPSSRAIRVRSGLFIGSRPARPIHPLVFLHGFGALWFRASGLFTEDGTWWQTLHFIRESLRWKYGGRVYHEGSAFTTLADFNGDGLPGDDFIGPTGDFFTVDFGDRAANYDDETGIVHQGTEVGRFLSYLASEGARFPFTLIAHSNGGLAARDYITRCLPLEECESTGLVANLATYGTPNRGADFNFRASARTLWAGARDASFDCGGDGSHLILSTFLQNLNARALPDGLRYSAVIGHSHSNFPLDAHRLTHDCHSEHWDGLVPITSADLQGLHLTSNPVTTLTTNRRHWGEQGNDFSSILCAIDPGCLQVTVKSPVEIAVVAPDGREMASDLAAIPGASFMDVADATGHLTSNVLIPFPFAGEYRIDVTPKAGSSATDTYTLEVTRDGVTEVLAQDRQIEDTPPGGFRTVVTPLLADMGVQQSGTPQAVLTGSTATYSLTVTNSGPNMASEVELVSVLPANTVIASLSDPEGWSCAAPGVHVGSLTCTSGVMPAGATASFVVGIAVACSVADGTRLSTSATVGSATEDPSPGNNTVTNTITALNPPPTIAGAAVEKPMLWPPDHKMVDVAVRYNATDNCDPAPLCALSMASNEPINGGGDGNTASDWEIIDSHHVRLRAERAGDGNGRVYTVTVTCTDVGGASSSQVVTVGVPHNQ